jgi:hypothetical protein
MMRVFLLIVLIFKCLILSAQDDSLAEAISSVAEELAADDSDPEAVSIYTGRLWDLAEKPVQVNSADESELSRLFFLTDFQVKSMAEYIRSSGRILTKYEIASIPGFDRSLAEIVAPFISLESDISGVNDTTILRGKLLSNISVNNRFNDSLYLGSPWKALLKVSINAGQISGGITMEKDAGERVLSGRPPLPDFLSGNFSWSGKGFVRKIILGDYSARFGLGSALSSGLRTGLSLTQTGYISGSDEIKPYSSTGENCYFRGIAGILQLRKTTISVFCSSDMIDASTDTAANSGERYVRTLYSSGLHNTLSSSGTKDTVKDFSFGMNILTDIKILRIGILFTGTRFSIPVLADHSDPEEIFDFSGISNYRFSGYYKTGTGKLIAFGEITADQSFRKAIVQGFSFRPDDRLTLNLLYRNYDPGFTSFHGKGIFSSSSGDNVRGLFGNFTFEAARFLFVSAGCDLKYFPWLSYRCSKPSTALSGEVRVKYLPSPDIVIEGLYVYRKADYDINSENGIRKQHSLITNSFRGSIKFSLFENMNSGIRIDYKSGGYDKVSKGMMMVQDITYSIRRTPIKIWLRYCIYKTDNWDTRLYVYENDLVYSFSIPAVSGAGSRSYLMVDWGINKFMNVRLKFGIAETMPGQAEETGHTTDLKMQLRMRF